MDDATKMDATDLTTEKAEANREEDHEEFIDLPSGSDFTPETSTHITAANLTRVILVAGEADTGKTTLLASLYEKFNERPFAGYLFAGSESLTGWERRCHLSRIASGNVKPDTGRTIGITQSLLHLRVRKATDRPQDMLFGDISGELFRIVRDSTEECKRLAIIKRADSFVLLIDGKNLSDPSQRHSAFHSARALLRSCLDAYMLDNTSLVDVVYSKYDLIQIKLSETEQYLQHTRDTIATEFQSHLARLRFMNIAARPDTDVLPFGYGLDVVFPSWVEDSPYLQRSLTHSQVVPADASEFERFLERRISTSDQLKATK
jgi:hypothetical protein